MQKLAFPGVEHGQAHHREYIALGRTHLLTIISYKAIDVAVSGAPSLSRFVDGSVMGS